MQFKISHITTYRYGNAAEEAYGEARLTPPDLPTQKVMKHRVTIEPTTRMSSYTDHFGNHVDFFSLPFRHQKLVVNSQMVVKTAKPKPPRENLQVSVQEARQIFSSALPDVFEYLQPTATVKTGNSAVQWSRRFLRGDAVLEEGWRR